MNERNENNSSKVRTYSLFAVALLLMGAGLFGSFYTLMGGMNAGKLAGKLECTYTDYEADAKCNENKCKVCKNNVCKKGSVFLSKQSGRCSCAVVSGRGADTWSYDADVDCPRGGKPHFKDGKWFCKTLVDCKETNPYPISCESNRVAGKQFKCTIGGGDFRSGQAYIVSGNCTKTNLTLSSIGVTCKSATKVKIRYVQGKIGKTSTFVVKATPTTTTKRYYQTPTTTSKTTTKAPLKNLQLTCKTKNGKALKNNSSVYTRTQIICETDVTGATFKVTGFKKKTLSGNNKRRKFTYKNSKTSAIIKVSKRGYKTNTISFKVLELQDLKLTCKQGNQTLKEGSTVTVYRPITCTVNTNGVRFKATGKKAVTLTESKKVYDFKYTKGKDSATIKVSKNGYKTKTIKFKVTENMKITSNSKKAFKIYCPSKVRVGDKFVCYVSEEYRGATITTKFNDEKEVVAAKNTKILYLKYDKPGTLKVSAKYGKNTLDRTIKIVDSETASKTKVHLNCSRTEVNSNEKFYCFSRIDGVQIKMDSKCKLNSGFNSTMTTSFANNTRKYANYFSCSKGDDTIVTVTATKDGYVSNSRTINIK